MTRSLCTSVCLLLALAVPTAAYAKASEKTPPRHKLVKIVHQPVATEQAPAEPYQGRIQTGFVGSTGIMDFDVVPEGRRLIVQYVSVASATSADSSINCLLSAVDSNPFVSHRLLVTTQERPSNHLHIVSAPITFYVEAGETPRLQCFIAGNDTTNFTGAITGYLVELEPW